MLESLMVYTVTLLLLFLILAVFILLYQEWNVHTIANESVTRVAQTYKLQDANTSTGETTPEDVADIPMYRYMTGGSSYEAAAKRRLRTYTRERLRQTTFAKEAAAPSIAAKVESDALARRHLELEITCYYRIPFGDALELIGMHNYITCNATAYAQCLDLGDYMTTVQYIDNHAGFDTITGSVGSAIDSILGYIDTLKNGG